MKLRRSTNVVLLSGGYLLGQGSLFAAQTWLISLNELQLLASFGTSFSFAVLGLILIEAGSVVVLARHTSQVLAEGLGQSSVWSLFWNTTVFRLALAAPTSATAIVYAIVSPHEFSASYLALASPALFLWALNPSGILDGIGRSGFSGATAAIPFIGSAAALTLCIHTPLDNVGIITGLAFTFGYGLAVLSQYAILWKIGWKPQLIRPTTTGLAAASRRGLTMLANLVPGQVTFRIQLVACTVYLGTDPTAVLVYATQLITAVVQFVGFNQRANFPTMVRQMLLRPANPVAVILRTQAVSTRFAWLGAIILLVLFSFSNAWAPRTLAAVLTAAVWFLPSIVVMAYSLALSQGAHALQRHIVPAIASSLTMLLGISLSLTLPLVLGLPGFALSNVASQCLFCSIIVYLLRSIPRESQE